MPELSTKYPDIRGHIIRKALSKLKWKGSAQTYNDKKASRKRRQEEIKLDITRQEFFQWIDNIQAKLGLDNEDFAKLLCVTYQTVMLWKRRSGHYPSKRSLLFLLRLERQAEFNIKIIQNVMRVRR